MTQDDLFDAVKSSQLKREGMQLAEDASDYLAIAREYAKQIARERGTATTDDVARAMRRDGLPDNLGPAAGSIFKGKEWEFTGQRRKSARITNHSRELRVWRLKRVAQ